MASPPCECCETEGIMFGVLCRFFVWVSCRYGRDASLVMYAGVCVDIGFYNITIIMSV